MPVFHPPDQRSASFLTTGFLTAAAWGVLAWQSHNSTAPLLWTLATVSIAWLALGWAMRHAANPRSSTIWGFALGFRVIAFFAAPVMEDDHYRFLWDGYRFAATGNPYAEAPQARFTDGTIPSEFRVVLDRINHPDVPTVYGPATQWAFRAAHAIAPARLWPWKLILLGAELVIFALLWPELSARGRLLLAWCPLAIFETGFNAHPDVLALALLVAAWRFGARGWMVPAGAALGAALAAKIFTLLLAPFVLWRLGWRAGVAAAGAVLIFYAPFWLRGSAADLTGLRAMAEEWEFNSSIHALAAAAASPAIARAGCALVFGAGWLALFLRWRKSPGHAGELPPGALIYGAFLLLSAVANPWYALWLWPFVALRPSATGIVALAVVSLTYVTGLNLGDPALGNFSHPVWVRPVEFGTIAIAALWDWRRRK